MRKAHVLKGNKSTQQWSHIACLAVQSQKLKISHTVQESRFDVAVGLHYDGSRNRIVRELLKTPDALWQWVFTLPRHKQRIVIIVNGLYLLCRLTGASHRLPEAGWTVGKYWFSEDSPTAFIYARKEQRSLLLLDSNNLFPVPPADLTHAARSEPMDALPTGAFPTKKLQRLQAEAATLLAATLQFRAYLKRHDLGNPSKTLAGQAFNTFRHRFMDHPIYIHDNYEALALEQQAYHGGRTECFRAGEYHGEFYKLDVNSMYPSLMARQHFPCKLIRYWHHGVSVKLLAAYSRRYQIIADVDIQTAVPRYPFVIEGRTIYPVGEFPTVLCHTSLCDALSHKAITYCERAALYDAAPLFSRYVDFWWRERRRAQAEGRTLDALTAKLLMNALYGKFGQRTTRVRFSETCAAEEFRLSYAYYEGKRELQWWAFGRYTQFESERILAGSSFPAISACITDSARIALWNLCIEAGLSNVFYCDTDALIVNRNGYLSLTRHIGEDLRQLKVEQAGSYLHIKAPKSYVLDDTVVRKGIRANAHYDVTSGEWQQTQAEGFRSALRRGNGEAQRYTIVGVTEATDIVGREVNGDGSTSPLIVGIPARLPREQSSKQ